MPIIIHGSRAITSVKQSGVFHCPNCNSKVNYKWKLVRKWGHLYFIPLVPTETLGEYVECQGCMNTYKPGVLEYDPTKAQRDFEAAYQAGIKRVMVRMMLADGAMNTEEVQLLRGLFLKVAGRTLDDAELDAEIQAVQAQGGSLDTSLAELAGMLNDRGKAAVFKAAYLVASADGHMDRAETDLLKHVATALGMSAEQLQQAVTEISAPR